MVFIIVAIIMFGLLIAVHEFGHNVEEVISLYDIDYYTLAGIPNTGFTEASAFLFQQRDMELLGYKSKGGADNEVLDMIRSVVGRKGRLDLPVVKGEYLKKISQRQLLQEQELLELHFSLVNLWCHQLMLDC